MNIPEFYRHLNIFKHYIYKLVNIRYYSISDLVGYRGTNGEKIVVDSYYDYGVHPTSQVKGRTFVYSTTQAKSGHNGITIISDTVPWNGTRTTLSDFHSGTGETEPSGTGAWVCKVSEIDPYMAGAVGDNVANDAVALQAAINYHVTNSCALYFPVIFLSNSTLSVTGKWNMYGNGFTSGIRTTSSTIPLLEFNITSDVYRAYMSGLYLWGPQNSNAASCALHFTGDNTHYVSYCTFKDLQCNGFNAFFKDEKTAGTTGSGQESLLSWNTWDNIDIVNTNSYGFWHTQGSGTGNTWNKIKPVLKGAGGSTWFFDGSGCVVGDILIDNIHNGGTAGSSKQSVKIGADTVYRSNISIMGSQFDANCDVPIDFSSTGSVDYSDIRFIGNNIGGAATLNPPYMTTSIIEGEQVDLRQEGRRITTDSTAANNINVFDVGVNAGGSSNLVITTNGKVGGVGVIMSKYEFHVSTDGATAVVTEIRKTLSTSAQLTWTATIIDVNTVRFQISFTPSSAGTSLSIVGVSRGHKHKLVKV